MTTETKSAPGMLAELFGQMPAPFEEKVQARQAKYQDGSMHISIEKEPFRRLFDMLDGASLARAIRSYFAFLLVRDMAGFSPKLVALWETYNKEGASKSFYSDLLCVMESGGVEEAFLRSATTSHSYATHLVLEWQETRKISEADWSVLFQLLGHRLDACPAFCEDASVWNAYAFDNSRLLPESFAGYEDLNTDPGNYFAEGDNVRRSALIVYQMLRGLAIDTDEANEHKRLFQKCALLLKRALVDFNDLSSEAIVLAMRSLEATLMGHHAPFPGELTYHITAARVSSQSDFTHNDPAKAEMLSALRWFKLNCLIPNTEGEYGRVHVGIRTSEMLPLIDAAIARVYAASSAEDAKRRVAELFRPLQKPFVWTPGTNWIVSTIASIVGEEAKDASWWGEAPWAESEQTVNAIAFDKMLAGSITCSHPEIAKSIDAWVGLVVEQDRSRICGLNTLSAEEEINERKRQFGLIAYHPDIEDFSTQLAHLVKACELSEKLKLEFESRTNPFVQCYLHVVSLLNAWVHPKNLALSTDGLVAAVGLAIQNAKAFLKSMHFEPKVTSLKSLKESLAYGNRLPDKTNDFFDNVLRQLHAKLPDAEESTQPVVEGAAGAGNESDHPAAQTAFFEGNTAVAVAVAGAGMANEKHKEAGAPAGGLG